MAEKDKPKHDPMRDNPAFIRANKEHRFTSENNPGKKGVAVRNFMRKLTEMTEAEVEAYVKNKDNPMFLRKVATTFMSKSVKPKDLCEFINQIEGMPTQPISTEEPPTININISADGNKPDE